MNDLKNGMIVMIEGLPYQVLEIKHLHMGRGGSSAQTRIRNLKTSQVFSRNFKPADTFGEADIEKKKLMFVYQHKGEFVFTEKNNPKNRFALAENQLGGITQWLKPHTECEAIFLENNLLTVSLPIKLDLKVIEAPPGIKGDTAQGGTKAVVTETGAKIYVPLFISEGDTIRVNTETGEYVERVTKGN